MCVINAIPDCYRISNLTINLTMSCNMRCTYCYVFSQELENAESMKSMSLDNISTILYNYAEYARKFGEREIDITWHGGEPLIVGLNFFEKIMNLEREIFETQNIIIRNRIQTNGTLINDQWCIFFKKYKFAIGISLDGPENIHNKNRFYANHKSSYLDTICGVKLLQKFSIPYGILCVITNDNYQYVDELYDFYKTLQVRSVDFIPSYLPEDSSKNIDPYKWGTFLVNIFNLWIKDLAFNIPYLNDIIKKQYYINSKIDYHHTSLMCELTDKCGQNLSITSDGNLYYCECLIGLPHYLLGNISNKSLLDLVYCDKANKILQEMNLYNSDCKYCNIFTICEGGCLKHRLGLASIDYLKLKDFFCCSKKIIIPHIRKMLNF